MESHFEPVDGIFDDSDVWQKYRISLKFTHLVCGGVPQKPEAIESWLRRRFVGGDQELAHQLRQTLADLGLETPDKASPEEVLEAARTMAVERNGNGFYRNGHGIALAGYQIKAMLKEATAILYPGGSGSPHKWGPTRKAPRSFLAERVVVDEHLVPLGREEPDGILTQVGHVDGPKGPRSTLTYVQYAIQPEITFTASSSEDQITAEQWRRILVQGQDDGLGAMRSLQHGRFKVTAFDKM